MRLPLSLPTLPAALAMLAFTCAPALLSQSTTAVRFGPVTDLGGLAGRPISQGLAINQAGHVVGFSGNSVGENDHAFLFRDGSMIDLGAPPFGSTDATAVNNLDDVAGYGLVLLPPPLPTRAFHAFFWSSGVRTDLGVLPITFFSKAYGINDLDQVVGLSGHAFLWDAVHGMQDLGTLPGGTSSVAYAINNSGQIVGYSTIDAANSTTHAFLYENGAMTDLGTLPGGTSSVARAINQRGDIVGYSTVADGSTHAFLYEDGAMIDLTTLPGGAGFTDAFAINEKGDVLGPNLLLKGGQVFDITVTSPPFAVPFFLGRGLNNRGIVAGATLGPGGHGASAAGLNTKLLLQGQQGQP